MRVRGQRHAPAALPPGKRPRTQYIGVWVGPRSGLMGAENLVPIGIGTVQPAASSYTDCIILAI